MRKIASEQTQEYKNSDLCIAKEYDLKTKILTFQQQKSVADILKMDIA